jgi:hypothetical protein
MLAKNQFLGLFFEETKAIPEIYKIFFNIIFCIVCLICGLNNYDPTKILR